jgi:hypothetical protein
MAIDLKRSFIGREVGNKTVEPTTSFNAGMIGTINSSGNVAVCDSTAVPAGILKWNKTSTEYGVTVDEPVVMNTDGTTASNLKHANVSNVKVRSVAGGGTTYILTTDYTVNAVNGTVTRVATITSGATVYISYTYQLTANDLASNVAAPGYTGLNFQLSTDDTQGSNKITLIQGVSTVYTDQYDTSRNYAINDVLYCTSAGIFINTPVGPAYKFGRVISVPTASDPFLGVEGNFIQDR